MPALPIIPRYVKLVGSKMPAGRYKDLDKGIEALTLDLEFRSAMADLLVEEGYVFWQPPEQVKFKDFNNYLTLGTAINRLSLEVDDFPDKIVEIGWDGAFSYRGDYSELALNPAPKVKVADMLRVLQDALGKTFQGWKGGEYTMTEYTEVYLCEEGCTTSNQLGPLLLEFLLNQEVKSK